jgi:cysteine desulfurase/selenocysteine lyase
VNREDFPLLNNNIIYLDNGATTLKPKVVIDRINDYYSNYSANAHRGDYDISLKVDNEYEGVREKVRRFINAKSNKEIVFTYGTTDSLNIIANGFFKNYLEDGDEILITKAEHASNVLPWFNIARNSKVNIKYIELNNEYEVTLDNIKKIVTNRTKLITLAAITNVLGDERPLKEIIEFAHNNNILVVIDGAQSVPHKRIDVRALDIDFLAFSAHKMCGPTGVGVLYAKEELMEHIEPNRLGGGMNESFDDIDKVYLKPIPTRLEAGTPNIAGVIGLGATIDYLSNIGLSNIRKHELELGKYLYQELHKIRHIDIVNKKPSSIISFNVNGIFAQDVAVYLNKYGICVRAGNHCAKLIKDEINVKNTVRVSLYFYNTKEEIDKLIELLKDKNKILDEML